MLNVVNSTLSSSLPSNSITYMAPDFGVSTAGNNPQLVLPISIYLVGYVLGPLLFGPLSEAYGRRWPMLITFVLYTAFTLGCALAPNWASMIVFRLLAGIGAAAPMTIIGGLYADIFDDPVSRGRVIAFYMGVVILAPCIGPTISGFISETTSWRWVWWFALILAGVTWIPMVFLPETYGPVILKHRAVKLRKAAAAEGRLDDGQVYSPIELEMKGWSQLFNVILARPFKMFFTEMIVTSTCIYLALVYAIFYMFFQAYPIVFKGKYGMSAGVAGLMFLPIGAGTCIALGVFFLYDGYLKRSRKAGKAWALKPQSFRLPLACFGGPLFSISLFWFGWTARKEIHWVVPILAGVPFGMGNVLIFMALLNYLTDAYKVFAASALAASACTRAIMGAVLCLATTSMYNNLGIGWASTLLGLISLVLCSTPFVFMYYGDAMQARSKFCQLLKAKEAADQESIESSS